MKRTGVLQRTPHLFVRLGPESQVDVVVSTPRMERILRVLRRYSEGGLWIRKLAREADVSPDTASRYVYDYLRLFVQIRELTDGPQKKVVFVRLIKEPQVTRCVGYR